VIKSIVSSVKSAKNTETVVAFFIKTTLHTMYRITLIALS